jgi:hypothetical protein
MSFYGGQLSPQLLTSAILGIDFFINTSAIINFPNRCAVFEVDNEPAQELSHSPCVMKFEVKYKICYLMIYCTNSFRIM